MTFHGLTFFLIALITLTALPSAGQEVDVMLMGGGFHTADDRPPLPPG